MKPLTHGFLSLAVITLALAGCSGAQRSTPETYTVGGAVSGLSGVVVLQNNGGDDLSISSNGPFAFSTQLASGSTYNVTILTHPASQLCAITKGSGTIANANITDISAECLFVHNN